MIVALALTLALLLAALNAALAAGTGQQMASSAAYKFVEDSLGPSTGLCGSIIEAHATLLTDSGTGGASWGPAVGQKVRFGLRIPDSQSVTWIAEAETDPDGVARAEMIVPEEGAVRIWAQHDLGQYAVGASQDIAFNTPGLTLTVNDAVYDGNPHGATAVGVDSCGRTQTPPIAYDGVYPTQFRSSTAPTNAGRYSASTAYFAGPYFFYDYQIFTIAPAEASVTPAGVTRQYSDPNPPLTGALSGFLARDGVTASYSTPADPVSAPGDYPIQAHLGPPGTPGLGNYHVTYNTGVVKIIKEEAHVSFDPANPAVLEASSPGGALNAGALTLRVRVQEQPDLPDGTAAAGEIDRAGLAVTLMPSTGGAALALDCSAPAVNSPYAAQTFTCTNTDAIPAGVYEVAAAVTGDFYAGEGTGIFTVDDPIAGFAIGGGWFTWPGLGYKTNFAFTAKSSTGGGKLKGSLLVIRHHGDGTISRLKSAKLGDLKLQNVNGCRIAAFTGQGTYRTWDAGRGRFVSSSDHAFTIYAEDCGKPGSGVDSFWIGGDGDLAMPAPASANKAPLGGGNIAVPDGRKE
jgi:hypothetical protein